MAIPVIGGQILTWSWKFTGRVLILQQTMRKLRQHLSFFRRNICFIKLADKKWPPIYSDRKLGVKN